MTHTSQNGFTLLELLLVIGVAALLLVGGISTYRMVTEGNKATDASRLLMLIKQEASLLAHQQNGKYEDIVFDSTSSAADASGGRSPLVIKGVLKTGQRNPFNGRVAITAPTEETLQVVFENISKPACLRLVQLMKLPSEMVSVGTATASYTSAASQIPVSVIHATAACDQVANTITWVFR